jgi:catechol 2,3-dioxygenase-like lactoylglutathione lyase family enzyme
MTMNRPAIEQQVTFLATRDLDVNAAFYADVLGLSLILDQGACRIYQTGRTAFLGFCEHLPLNSGEQPVIITLVSQDVDGWYDYVSAKGVAIEKRPTMNTTYNIYHFFMRDPDGYLVEIQRFLDPAWPSELS